MKTAAVESTSRPAHAKAGSDGAPVDEAAFADAMRKSSEALEQGEQGDAKAEDADATSSTAVAAEAVIAEAVTAEAVAPEEAANEVAAEGAATAPAALPIEAALMATLGMAMPMEAAPPAEAASVENDLEPDTTTEGESTDAMMLKLGLSTVEGVATQATRVDAESEALGSVEGGAEDVSASADTDAGWKTEDATSDDKDADQENNDASAQGDGAPELTSSASASDTTASEGAPSDAQGQPMEAAPAPADAQTSSDTVKTPDAPSANLWTVDAARPRAATVVAQWRARSMHDRAAASTATATVAAANAALSEGETTTRAEGDLASKLSGVSIGHSASDKDIGTSWGELKGETASFSDTLSFADFAGDSTGFVAPTPLNEARIDAALGNAEVPQQTMAPQRAPLAELAGSALWTMRANNAHDASVELVHADLGRLRIDVKASRADVAVQIEAPTQIAAGVLQASEGALRASLGKRLRSFRVNTAGESDAESVSATRDGDESPYESEDVK